MATISLQNVTPGMHTLTAVPTLNDHTEIEENGNSITIDYEPTHPLPTIIGASFAGAPAITILSPKNDAFVSGTFDVVVKVTNYHLSCNLMGKPDSSGLPADTKARWPSAPEAYRAQVGGTPT